MIYIALPITEGMWNETDKPVAPSKSKVCRMCRAMPVSQKFLQYLNYNLKTDENIQI